MKIIWAFTPFVASIAVIAMFSHPTPKSGPDATELAYKARCERVNVWESTECQAYRGYHELSQQY
jgi:hypothetical protein